MSKPVETFRYPRFVWVGDTIWGGMGLALLGLWTYALMPSQLALLPLAGVAACLYLIGRGLWLLTVRFELSQDDLVRRAFLVPEKRIELNKLTNVDLLFLGTVTFGRRAKRGLFMLKVTEGRTDIRVESRLQGFHPVAEQLLARFVEQGGTISLKTYDNADALDISAGLKVDLIDRP